MNFRCPECGSALEKVRQSEHSMLNAEQFDAGRRGDYFCRGCPGHEEEYRYFWVADLAGQAASAPSIDLTAEISNLMQFYGVNNLPMLVAAQARHVQRLQAKFPSGTQQPFSQREG